MQTDSRNHGTRVGVKSLDETLRSETEKPLREAVPVFAIVTDCIRLNLRKAADRNAPVLKELPALTKVKVDVNGSTEEFCRIQTSEGVNGYCMRKYLTLLP